MVQEIEPAPTDWTKLCTQIVKKYGNIDSDDIRLQWMLSNKNQKKEFKNIMKGWISFFNEVKYMM